MPDLMWEPGRLPAGIKPLPLEAVLPRSDLPEVEGNPEGETLPGEGELSEEQPLRDRLSEEMQQALDQWAMGSLKKLAMEVQERLTEELLSWKPDPKKSEEDNLAQLRETVRRHNEVLASRGGSLSITRPLEEALLEALAKWLEQMMEQLLRLLGPDGSPDEVAQLLEKLFRQMTGASPARGRVAARAAAILQESAGFRVPQGRPPLSEEGVVYRRGGAGARLDHSYSGQARRAQEQEARPIELGREAPRRMERDSDPKIRSGAGAPAGREVPVLQEGRLSPRLSASSPEAKLIQELRFAEKFAKTIAAQPGLPPTGELPYLSEERLGLELGLLWLKGEAAARESAATSPTAALIRQAAERRAEGFFFEASRAFQAAARAYPPGLCPDLWRGDVFRVRDELVRRYRLKKDPQRSLLETIAYTIELFQEKQGKEKYRTWLRYLPGRGLFLSQPGWEDIRRGWQAICRSWDRFLQDMNIRNTAAFREAVGLQSLWAMILPPPKKAEERHASFWTLTGWLGTAAAVAAVAYAAWSAVSPLARAAAIIAACLFAGAAFLLFRKSRGK